MARTKFKVEVLTPEGEVFNDEVEMVSTRTTVGSIGVLANHQPLLGLLDPTELRLYRSDSDIERFAQGEGYLQVGREGVLVLVEEAMPPDQLDVSELQEKLRKAEQELEQADEDSEQRRRALRDKRRWEAFLRIAEGSGGGARCARPCSPPARGCGLRSRARLRSPLARAAPLSARPVLRAPRAALRGQAPREGAPAAGGAGPRGEVLRLARGW
ncbi:MAG: F-type H+-transporting ATPase subunit epsilon [Solirubrobacteraceae bacterium]|nr:F-type H+-transporting ATPase subunit epsilon [Solirubrobacteraceae bacterium]